MGHLVRNYERCSIDVDSDAGIILVRQRWHYLWVQGHGTSAWTLAEQRAMHARFEAAILREWSNRAWLRVTGDSPYARRLVGRELSLRFDVQRVTANQHWTVSVKKIRRGDFDGSTVDWKKRRANFDSEDSVSSEKLTPGGMHLGYQTAVAHEFGHMIGNDDEHQQSRPNSPHRRDIDSMLNAGNQLRARHFNVIVAELNRLAPDTGFSVSRVR